MDHHAGKAEAEKVPLLFLLVSLVYVALNMVMLLGKRRRAREDEAYLRRVPQTRMFPALVASLLDPSERDPISGASLSDSEGQDLDDLVRKVADRRLRRIEGLRAHLSRRSLGRLAWRATRRSVAVRPMDSRQQADVFSAPGLWLSVQQARLAGFVRLCTQLLIALYVARMSQYPPQAVFDDMKDGKVPAMWPSLVLVVVIQCVIAEAACRCAQLLLHVCNRESRRRKHLAEMVVECDVPWIEPQSSEESSELAVSLLRLSIVQLEMAHSVVRDKGLMEAACSKRREAEKEDMDTGRTDSRIQPGTLAEVDRQVLLLQLQDKLLQARCMLLEEYRAGLALHVAVKLSTVTLFRGMSCGEGSYLVEFIENPLEHFLMRARVAKYYDEYIQGAVYSAPLSFIPLIIYKLFISEPTRHACHEDLSVISWRAVLPKAILWVYVMALFCVSLRLSYYASAEVAERTGLILALGLAFGWLVLAPLVSLIIKALGCHILLRMFDELTLSHGTIRRLCANVARIHDKTRQEMDSDKKRPEIRSEPSDRGASPKPQQTSPMQAGTAGRLWPSIDADARSSLEDKARREETVAPRAEEEPPPCFSEENGGGLKVGGQGEIQLDPSKLPRDPPPPARDPGMSSSKSRRNRSHIVPINVSPEGSYAENGPGPSVQTQAGGHLYLSHSQRSGAGSPTSPSASANRRSNEDSGRGLGESGTRHSLGSPEGTRQGERRRRQRASERRSDTDAAEGRRSLDPSVDDVPPFSPGSNGQGTRYSGSRRNRQASRDGGEEQGLQDGRARGSLRSREDSDSRQSSLEDAERRERVSSGRGGRASDGGERRSRVARRSRGSRGSRSDDDEEPEELEAQYL